jgi:hypothetical protein
MGFPFMGQSGPFFAAIMAYFFAATDTRGALGELIQLRNEDCERGFIAAIAHFGHIRPESAIGV